MQRKTWTLSQVSMAGVCHYKALVLSVASLAQPLKLMCTTTEVDVPWSNRVKVPRIHCVPGLPSQKPREQQRGVLRPAVLQAPQPKVLSQTGKGLSHSLKYRGKRTLWVSPILRGTSIEE